MHHAGTPPFVDPYRCTACGLRNMPTIDKSLGISEDKSSGYGEVKDQIMTRLEFRQVPFDQNAVENKAKEVGA